MPTHCYLIEQTDRQRLSLRRFVFGISAGQEPDQRHRPCKAATVSESGYRSGCDASTPYLEEVPLVIREDGIRESPADIPRDDPRWPTVCEGCGEPFDPADTWQTNGEPIYVVTAAMPGAALQVGAETPLRDAPPGAIWEATWAREWAVGFDGRALICRLPDGHDWQIDGEASNCTRKGDRSHRCWIRHGEPPELTVDKNGETCAAGAGSIASPGYHGFLRAGILEP